MCGFYGVSGVIEKAVTHELDGTAIAQGGDLRVKRELIEHLEVVLCRDLVDVAFAVDLERLTAARALDIAVIFDETEHGHIHHFRHFDRFGDDHGDELLRGGDDDDAVERDGLEHRERCVAGSGGQVDKHVIDFIPDDVAPELLDDTGDNRAAPDDRGGLIRQKLVDAHSLDAGLCVDRKQAVIAAHGLFVDAEALRNRRTGDVGVENGGFKAAALHGNSQHRGDKAFAYAAFAADNADDLFDIAHLIHGRKKAFRILAGRTFLAAAGAVVRTIFAHC